MSEKKDLVVKMTINSTDFENGLRSAKSEMKQTERSVKQGVAAAKSAISKIAIAVGAATAAWKSYKSMAEQTQTWGDELNNSISASKEAFQGLQREIIMGGDLAVGKLRDMYNEAYKLAQLKDQLGTLKISQQWNRGTYLTDYNEAMADYQEAKTKKDEEGMAKAARELNEALNGYTRESQELIQTTKDEARQLLIANNISVGANENIYDVMNEVKQAQNGNLMGITNTLKELSKKTSTTYSGGTAGTYTVETGGLEWGKTKMRNLGYSDAQIAMAERQLRMSELNDPKYQELVSTLLEGKNVQNEIAALRKRAARVMSATEGHKPIVTTPEENGLTFEQEMEMLRRQLEHGVFSPQAKIIPLEDLIEEEGVIEDETDALVEAVNKRRHALEKMADEATAATYTLNAFTSICNSIASISGNDMFSSIAKGLGSIATTASSTIATMMALAGAETVEGLAEVFSSAPPYTKIALTATALAGILSMIATAKSAFAGSYANGGIVGGNSYSGDKLWARVNSGEMILNRNQQAALSSGGQVKFVIEGSQLKGVLDNYNSIQNM